jgi:hypothetical protein
MCLITVFMMLPGDMLSVQSSSSDLGFSGGKNSG